MLGACSAEPVGGAACAACSVFTDGDDECEAECNGRVCGDDGCGGSCGACAGDTPSCSSAGECVAAGLGTCAQPYELFGLSREVGSARLSADDTTGIKVYVLELNSVDSSAPSDARLEAPVTQASPPDVRALLPADGITVPVEGIRMRLVIDTSSYSDIVTPPQNTEGVPEIVFRFRVPAHRANYRRAFEVYAASSADVVGMQTSVGAAQAERDTYLALLSPNCGELETGYPADQLYNDDATPPGNYGSRIFTTGLVAGDYTVSWDFMFIFLSFFAPSQNLTCFNFVPR